HEQRSYRRTNALFSADRVGALSLEAPASHSPRQDEERGESEGGEARAWRAVAACCAAAATDRGRAGAGAVGWRRGAGLPRARRSLVAWIAGRNERRSDHL